MTDMTDFPKDATAAITAGKRCECGSMIVIGPTHGGTFDYFAYCNNADCSHHAGVGYDPQREPHWVRPVCTCDDANPATYKNSGA